MNILRNLKQITLLVFSMILSSGILFAQEADIPVKDSLKLGGQSQDIYNKVYDGYSIQEKKDITGSVSIVEPALLRAIPAGNISNLLQGRASGVTVTGSGMPGETSKVRIRGFASFMNNDPLYVVDGVPTQDISLLNPIDVASVSVLKDAGAASIYGSRASNGVIIVTTRKGNKGFNVTYDMSMGMQLPGKGTRDDVLSTKEYADLQWLVNKNDGTVETHPIYGVTSNPSPSIPAWAANTDWYDAITDPAGIMNHNLTLSGGSENAKFYAGFGVLKQDGIIIYTHNTRYNARLNSDFTFLKDRIKAGESFSMSYRDNLSVPNLNDESPIQMGPYRSQSIIPVKIAQPITGPAHDFIQGEWGGTGISSRLGNAPNVVVDFTRNKDDYFRESRLNGSMYLEIYILEGFNFRSAAGGTWDKGSLSDNQYATYERSENIATTSLAENTSYGSDWVWTNSLTFDKKFGNHKVLAVAGYEAVNYGNGLIISGSDTSDYTPTRMLSAFVKADYAFMDRYLFSAILRRDGCSRFSESQRYGLFPSFSAGWHISNESFMDKLKWISDLKIRGSWGIMGNQFALSPQNAVYIFGESIGASWYDLYGTFNSSVRGYYPIRVGNPDAKWETNTTTDIGFDAMLFKNKINIVFDWYSKITDDLLYNPELPGTAGVGDAPFVNIASMKNSGIDIELSYQNKWNNLGFNGSIIITAYKNEITRIAEMAEYFNSGSSWIGSLVRNEEGHSLSSFYGYQVTGLFQNANEVDRAPMQDGASPGFFRYKDTNKDDYIGTTDRVFLGDPNPDFTYGLNLILNFKGLDLTTFLYGSQGNDIFNYNKWWTDFWPSFQGQKSKDLFYNSWTDKNTSATVPKASNYSNFSTNTQASSYYIENGSYLRFKSLQLGYTLPESITGKIKIKSLRIYLQAVNLFTITGYSGLDPELSGSDLAFGIDYGNYPNAKQFIFGLNLTL
ncbi:MAG: SusC/RagA family TonB-linked outer membrane protein [Bacteroidia bacterium]|nr:SusC/RagA family TonB-linked outer membrane protein [Bacteroidia bacterium]